MRDLSMKRQKATSLKKKAEWALGQQRDFNELLGDIKNLIEDLEVLFPVGKGVRQQLAEEQAKAIDAAAEKLLPLLKEIAAEQDHALKEALEKDARAKSASEARTVHSTRFGNYNTGFQVGGGVSGGTFNMNTK